MWTRVEVYQILGNVLSGKKLTKIQATSRSGNLWPEGSKTGKVAQKKENPEWANEEPKVHNVSNLREIHCKVRNPTRFPKRQSMRACNVEGT